MIKNFNFPARLETDLPALPAHGKLIGEIQYRLVQLGYEISASDRARKELAESTAKALGTFIDETRTPVEKGDAAMIVSSVDAEFIDHFVRQSKKRTRIVQDLITATGWEKIADEERASGQFGPTTENAWVEFIRSVDQIEDHKISRERFELLRERVREQWLATPAGIRRMHKILIQALRVAGLSDHRIADEELRGAKIGSTTGEVLNAFQKKYNLVADGKPNLVTLERLETVAVSTGKPAKTLKSQTAGELAPVRRTVRLNMQGAAVVPVQRALAYFGYSIASTEAAAASFGKTTQAAVRAFQADRGLEVSGHLDTASRKVLNAELLAQESGDRKLVRHRVRGSVRDDVWVGMADATVRLSHQVAGRNPQLLAEKPTGKNGFFDLPYTPPQDKSSGRAIRPFHLLVEALDSSGKEIGRTTIFNPLPIVWANFTAGDRPYRGPSGYEILAKAMQAALGIGATIASLRETDDDAQISRAAETAGVAPEQAMRMVLAHLVATQIGDGQITPPVVFALLGVGQPTVLPSDLLTSTDGWELIDQLVLTAANGLIFTEADVIAEALDDATEAHLFPIGDQRRKAEILEAFEALRTSRVRTEPLLSGNASLEMLMAVADLSESARQILAEFYLQHGSFEPEFWTAAQERVDDIGGAEALNRFRTIVLFGEVTRNFRPLIQQLLTILNNSADNTLTKPSDVAKLTRGDWRDLLVTLGSLPQNADGETESERRETYALSLFNNSHTVFPEQALFAELQAEPNTGLKRIGDVAQVFDSAPGVTLASDNLELAFKREGVSVEDAVLIEAKVIQRVHRIASKAPAARLLLTNRLHDSAQIVGLGKQRFIELLTADESMDAREARVIFARAEWQHAKVLQTLSEYHPGFHRFWPSAMPSQEIAATELPPETEGLANLDTLFGSLDFCACHHCRSVYGPAAYLADVFRYLGAQKSTTPDQSVLDLLIGRDGGPVGRRPDLARIKLDCDNAETPLPYIDLVLEVLESRVDAPDQDIAFTHQTTWRAEVLLAAQEHQRSAAYERLREVVFPFYRSLDLWNAEVRTFLAHFGVSRPELIEVVHAPLDAGAMGGQAQTDYAAEIWGLPPHEYDLIISSDESSARQSEIWGFDGAPPAELSVAEFMRRADLTYDEVLTLLATAWPGEAGTGAGIELVRPEGTCDLNSQRLINFTSARYDRLHRFLRFAKKTKLSLHDVDRMIRHPGLGAGVLDAAALSNFAAGARLMHRLDIGIDEILLFFAPLDTEAPVNLREPDEPELSPYAKLFLNPESLAAINPAFELDALGVEPVAQHKASLAAALAISVDDVSLITAILDDATLNLDSISEIARHAVLARALDRGVGELLNLMTATGTVDPFASPRALGRFIQKVDAIKTSRFDIDTLSYLISGDESSVLALRDETIADRLRLLREALIGTAPENLEETVVAWAASAFGIAAEAVRPLLQTLEQAGTPYADHLRTDALTARGADGIFVNEITPESMADLFTVAARLHRISLYTDHFYLSSTELTWLATGDGTEELLRPQDVAAPNDPDTVFTRWHALTKWKLFADSYPAPEETSLPGIFALASTAATPEGEIHAAIAQLTQWPLETVAALAQTLGASHSSDSDYLRTETYLRMDTLYGLARRIGVEIDVAGNLTTRESGQERVNSESLRQALRGKYDEPVWLQKLAGLEDELRHTKRDALLAYLIARSQRDEDPDMEVAGERYRNPAYWRDAGDALGYLLIDVEMSACQLTSRLKQATSSVQMYVQRCLLGLEEPFVEVGREELEDEVSDNSWRQWRWMQSYRVWEANRKIFLYPENWIEPELRDDKSPFFEEFERDILQTELTEETAEAGLRRYLERVEEVADLEVVGEFRELDNTRPEDGLPADVSLVHVVARTREQPHRYFYRAFDQNLLVWSAWERIDAEIEGDQAVPVVYNRRLHLLWLSIEQKPIKQAKLPAAKPTDQPSDAPELPEQLEIRLAWSVRTKDGWSAKRQSAQKLIHPWPRPRHAYTIKPRYRSQLNELWVDLFITQSPEFNSSRFWDSFTSKQSFMTSRVPYSATAWPWHSSSFVFDGSVKDVRLKPLRGAYRLLRQDEVGGYKLTATNSHYYLQRNFGEEGREIQSLDQADMVAPRMPVPQGMHFRNGRLRNRGRAGARGSVNVLENRATHTLMYGGISPFEVVGSLHQTAFDTARFGPVPFFYQDPKRAFFVRPLWRSRQLGYNHYIQTYQYDFYPFYHPYASLFLRELDRDGVRGLLQHRIQTVPQLYHPQNNYEFEQYSPSSRSQPHQTAAEDRLDFTREGAYSIYNWETFVHIPFTVACRLSENQRFEEAMRWFHTIFDPTGIGPGTVPQRYWVSKPFHEMGADEYRKQRITNLLEDIEQHVGELRAWKNDPFKPYVIARFRPVALQKAIVMKYLDNLIAWADQLFRRDSIESINQATTLYLLAHEILGRKPEETPHIGRTERTWLELTEAGELDPFGNAKVETLLENLAGSPAPELRPRGEAEPLPLMDTFYFCIPNNDRLARYWALVEDRLWKIRHCQNIEGVTRQLTLFQPPIDPALLVKASAAGIDLSALAAPSAAALGPYRFRALLAVAERFIGSVNALGTALLNALERRDAEELSVLRAVHETQLRDAMHDIRKLAIDESEAQLKVLDKRLDAAEHRKTYYQERSFMNIWEGTAMTLSGFSAVAESSIALGYTLAGGLSVIPGFVAGASGFGGSPHTVVETPAGEALAKAAESAVATIQAYARSFDKLAALASTMGSYQRRKEEWDFQAGQSGREADRLEVEIAAAQIRRAMAEEELRINDREREQAAQAEEYFKVKYTNAQLYDWMLAQVSTTYFQAYQLAFDIAKSAEMALQQELCEPTASFVQFGHWDTLRKGLLSGERLGQDLRRMEAHYLTLNRRELEIQKHISLAELAPLKLLELKTSGSCTFALPEWLFDMDYPGHYRRRLKAVSVTVPAVVGPYTNVNATLTLVRNSIRVSSDVAGGYGDALVGGDERFLARPVAQSAIATSHGRSDSGMFIFDFTGDRFLPFEGAGAVSEWTLELPQANNRFDMATVSDIVLHLHYTAQRSGETALADAARANIEASLPQAGVQLLDLHSSFGSAWRRFLVSNGDEDQELLLDITEAHLPYFLARRGEVAISGLDLVLDTPHSENFIVEVTPPGGAPSEQVAAPEADFEGRPHMAVSDFAPGTAATGTWRFRIRRSATTDFHSLTEGDLKGAYLVLGLGLA
ncbi:neuraminidase-like domain-containing protein [Microbulbifer sp. TYP-18]|uniref:Tc toxin subunit A-related protein n=1 Tax=Microbulbifer sp. TYP-18 TaxID=3230024 RepID=UPI0034C5F91E